MVGEREINIKTKNYKIDGVIIDVLLPMMLENIENASKLNEEDFYLLDTLIKCKLQFANIEVSDDYSENVQNLLDYCKREDHTTNSNYSYTYISLTENNIDKLFYWLVEKVKADNELSVAKESALEGLVNVKGYFYEEQKDNQPWIEFMVEMEKLKGKFE